MLVKPRSTAISAPFRSKSWSTSSMRPVAHSPGGDIPRYPDWFPAGIGTGLDRPIHNLIVDAAIVVHGLKPRRALRDKEAVLMLCQRTKHEVIRRPGELVDHLSSVQVPHVVVSCYPLCHQCLYALIDEPDAERNCSRSVQTQDDRRPGVGTRTSIYEWVSPGW